MDALTRAQRSILVLAAVATAVTRWLALAKTPWDWDEMLFILAMRNYDVAAHHPHPPGFPLWIFFADLVHALHVSEFRSLQLLAFLASIAIVPAMFAFCRALRAPFGVALGAAAILAFFPNVWFFGGTALSDVPSMTLVIAALALLLGERTYIAGVIVLAIAAGIRPQNLLIGAVPLVVASRRQRRRDVVVAALAGIAIVGASYGVAIAKTGWSAYRETVALHGQYIAKTDSFRSPLRPPLWRVFIDFFVRPYRMPAINVAVTLFAAIGLACGVLKRRYAVLLPLAAFGPFCLFAWLMLDRFSASRFSIGYAPLIALLVAYGLRVIPSAARNPLTAILVAGMLVWTWPALRIVHTTVSPPVQAAEWIRANVDRRTPLYVHRGMAPYAEALLPERESRFALAPPAPWTSGPTPLFLREDAGARNFVRERGHLWWLTRQRYFVVSVTPVTERAIFRSGWYDEEGSGNARWRWMSGRGVIDLPRGAMAAALRIALYVPLDALGAPPNIVVRLDGKPIAQLRATTPNIEIEKDVAGGTELAIETDRTVQPPHDARVLGLRLNGLEWSRRK
ncbi:MAG TPA: hypothetical protein VI670_03970 [Thermoanaerobaculia bacterium]|jgi:hypothetical protein